VRDPLEPLGEHRLERAPLGRRGSITTHSARTASAHSPPN